MPNIKHYDSGTTFGFFIFSKTLVNYLTKVIGLPLGKKYNSLSIPKIFSNKELIINFIRGLFDTDGCICFKRRYSEIPYYPVISISSKSKNFIKDIAIILKDLGFKLVEIYDYEVKDIRVKRGFTTINRIELNGERNLKLWIEQIGFFSPKHIEKINKYWKDSEEWI